MTKTKISEISLVFLFVAARPLFADVQTDLKDGKILKTSIPSSGIWPGRAMGVVNAPADEVFKVVTDFAAYQKFVSQIKISKQVEGKKDEYYLEGEFPWPLKKTWVRVRIKLAKNGEVHFVNWEMIAGTMKKYEGMAWIQPWGKNRTVLTYQMLAVPSISAPNAIMAQGLKQASAELVKVIREQVEKKPYSKSF
ncbi:MAG: SRPBCC family protein [Pseudomonadota bacterium]